VWLLYWAITTLIDPDELPDDPEFPPLPPQAATVNAAAAPTTATALRLVNLTTTPPVPRC
jgi:hypothetical protein